MKTKQSVAQFYKELTKLNEIELPSLDTKDFDDGETARAVRQGQIAELDAVNDYEQKAQSTHDPDVKKIFQTIADEEKVHQGEFETLTNKVDPKNKEKIDDGKKEAEDTLEEGIATGLGRALGTISNVSSGIQSAAKNFRTNLNAGIQGITDDQLNDLKKRFEIAPPISSPPTLPSPSAPENTEDVSFSNSADLVEYFEDLYITLANLKNPSVDRALETLARRATTAGAEGDFTKWDPSNLRQLNVIGRKILPNWTPRELQGYSSIPKSKKQLEAAALYPLIPFLENDTLSHKQAILRTAYLVRECDTGTVETLYSIPEMKLQIEEVNHLVETDERFGQILYELCENTPHWLIEAAIEVSEIADPDKAKAALSDACISILNKLKRVPANARISAITTEFNKRKVRYLLDGRWVRIKDYASLVRAADDLPKIEIVQVAPGA